MFVILNRPGAISVNFYDDSGEQKQFTFQGGRNYIISDVWEKIKKSLEPKWDYYGKLLREIRPLDSTAKAALEEFSRNEILGVEDSSKFEDLPIEECIAIVQSVDSLPLLQEYLWAEQARGRNRKVIKELLFGKIDAIEKNIKAREKKVYKAQEKEMKNGKIG